jgi:uncharacterized protein DUF4180
VSSLDDSSAQDALADLTTAQFTIQRPADILELVAAGAHQIVLLGDQLHPDFFDLSTGFAGELVQKCMNYGIRIAIVETRLEERSASFRQFAQESSRHGRFVFAPSLEEARARLEGA